MGCALVSSADVVARFVLDLENPDEVAPVSSAQARQSYAAYLRYVTRGHYREARHTKLLCEKLEAVERGEITRLMVFMPPRHSKSETSSKHFPGYYIGRNPQKRAMLASYGDELAREFGRMNRDDLEEHGEELFGVNVSPKSSAAHRWDLAGKRGGMVTAGVGGPLTGKGAHLLVIDDPYKDWEEAQSPTIREKVWNWYRSVAYTRLQKGGAIIIIQTRWHEDDLSGRLLAEAKNGGEQWEVLSLPAEAEADDPLGRSPGEPLWPEGGFDAKWLARTKRAVGSFIWAALYQQRPAPVEGGIWKRHWWRYWRPKGVKLPPVTVRLADGEHAQIEADELPDQFDVMLQSWDMAFKDTKASDFVAGGVWAVERARRYLLDLTHDRLSFTESCQAVRSMREKWPEAYAILIEDKANGPAIINSLEQEVGGIIPVTPEGGKLARAHAVSPFIEAGNVYLPHPLIAPWVEGFLAEATLFPNGPHDDMVDQTSQALRRFAEGMDAWDDYEEDQSWR